MGPEIGPGIKIGKNSPKNGFPLIAYFWAILFLFSFRDLFQDLFGFLFRAEGLDRSVGIRLPLTGVKIPKIEKRGFQSPKSHFWAHSEGHPHTEGRFTGTLVNVGDLRRNSGECQGAYPGYDVVGSPKFAKLLQKAHACCRYTLEFA